eukprot:6784407-Karenia_brevis.AAC.1
MYPTIRHRARWQDCLSENLRQACPTSTCGIWRVHTVEAAASGRPQIFDDRYEEGIYLGPIDGRSCVYVAQGDSIVQARSIKRRPLQDRWSKDEVMK